MTITKVNKPKPLPPPDELESVTVVFTKDEWLDLQVLLAIPNLLDQTRQSRCPRSDLGNGCITKAAWTLVATLRLT